MQLNLPYLCVSHNLAASLIATYSSVSVFLKIFEGLLFGCFFCFFFLLKYLKGLFEMFELSKDDYYNLLPPCLT